MNKINGLWPVGVSLVSAALVGFMAGGIVRGKLNHESRRIDQNYEARQAKAAMVSTTVQLSGPREVWNEVSGNFSMVVGGADCQVSGDHSIAIGQGIIGSEDYTLYCGVAPYWVRKVRLSRTQYWELRELLINSVAVPPWEQGGRKPDGMSEFCPQEGR